MFSTASGSDSELRFGFVLPFQSRVNGVGHDEDSSSDVRRSDVGGRYRVGAGSMAKVAEVPSDGRDPPLRAARDVFDDDDARAHFGDDSREFPPEPGPCSVEPGPLSRARYVLTGEPSADDIHGSEICAADRADIVVPRDVGPVLREHGLTELVAFDLPKRRPEPGPFKAKFQTADARE